MTFGTKTLLNTFMWMMVAVAMLVCWALWGFSIESFFLIATIFAFYMYSRLENSHMNLQEKLDKVLSNQEEILKRFPTPKEK